MEIELEVYQEYLQRRHETIPDFLHDTKKPAAIFQHLIQNDRFQSALRQQILIPPADPRFADWAPKRKIFEERLNQSLAYRFGYSPARKNYLGIATYMFLHDGIIPLVGNMLFLWFVGSWLEIGIGRILFLGIYLVTGAFSGLSFGFIHPLSQGPLLGASGAIAGLMGTYLLLYCGKRNNVLCSLGFCSRHTTLFGWFLFPFWASKEVYLFANSPETETVAVHVGGLLAGLMIGLVFRTNEGKQTEGKEIPTKLQEEAIQNNILLSEQDVQVPNSLSEKEAVLLRKKIIAELNDNPNNLNELARLFHFDKRSPKGDQFHRTAGKLLRQLAAQERSQDLYAYFEEYRQVSGAPRLHPSVMLALAEIHIHSGKTAQAARLLLLLLKQRPQYPGLPSSLFKLGSVYREQGKEKRAEKCFQLICKQYPLTIISQQAEEMLIPPYSIAVR
ncbi:MAG: rhomboid family intramembrane serine protease [Candidatus Electrothrix sp. AR5]|nr:rhomboid family intramembrane serine protease [Candidatus Electrothrix sp. AR5]